MAKGIDDDAVTVAPKHVHRRHLHLGAGLDRALDRGIAIGDELMNGDRRSLQGFGRPRFASAELRKIINEKQKALADAKLRMHDAAAIRGRNAGDFLGAECLLVKADCLSA